MTLSPGLKKEAVTEHAIGAIFFSPPTLFNAQTSSSSCFLAFQFIFEIDFGSAFAAVARETEKPSLRRRRRRLSESNVEAEKNGFGGTAAVEETRGERA